MENVIYTTACGMFRVIEENGAFIPQERIVTCPAYSARRIATIQEEQALRNAQISTKVYATSWQGWHLGRTCRNEDKGFKSFKSATAAIKFVERCSEDLQEVA